MEERVQKVIAEAGIASRRHAEMLIEEGRVKVNGETITIQGVKVDPEKDVVEVDGKVIKVQRTFKYYMLHKPVRYVTTAADEKGRATVLDLLPKEIRVYPVGRLDYLSSGLLLLTNDGDLTYRLTHPKHHVNKCYKVQIEPKVTREAIEHLEKGVDLDVYKTSACSIRLFSENATSQTYEVIIHEGKNRQIRRMFNHIGSQVIQLERQAIGELKLEGLAYGKYRELTMKEVNYLKGL